MNQITTERAKQLVSLMRWQNGGCLASGSVRPNVPDITPNEDAAIRAIWKTCSGDSTYAGVLHDLASGRIMLVMT